MKQTRNLRAVLKRDLVPALESAGFQGKFPEFRRVEGGELQLLSIVFDQHGGGFFLEFSNCRAGDMQTSWGEVVPERELTVAHTPIESRARLQQPGDRNSLREDWFRYEDLSANELDQLMLRVVELLPQISDWLRDKKVGRNISTTAP